MIGRGVIAFSMLLLSMQAAAAGLSRAVLDSVAAAPPPDAHLALSLSARDASGRLRSLGAILDGRPAFISFVDYTCNTLCGTDLMLLADGIRRSGLKPSDFRIIVFGIDPKDSARSAIAMAHAQVPPAFWPATVILLPGRNTVAKATAALGFHYVYDPAIDQFAHPAIVYAIGPDGRLRRAFSPMNLLAGDISAAMRPTAPPVDLHQRVRLLCYAYDPVTGIYTPRVTLFLKIGAGLALAALGIFVALLSRRRRLAR